MKAAIYIRISTNDKRQDLDMQKKPLEEYARNRKMDYIIYNDMASGSDDKRPGLTQLLQDARRRSFNYVLVWKFDRFARSTRMLLESLDEFQKLGIHFISLHENIDTALPMGKAMFTLIAAIAELERDLIRERVLAGMQNAKEKGIAIGRPSLDEEIKNNVTELFKAGLSRVKISKQLGIHRRSVQRILATPAQKGVKK